MTKDEIAKGARTIGLAPFLQPMQSTLSGAMKG